MQAAWATWGPGNRPRPAVPAGTAPTISVIVPAYRRPELLREALASIAKQSRGDWECLVVDSGFADRVRETVESFGDPRISYRTHHPPGVAATARNAGVAATRGRILAFLDQDDVWHPRWLERGVARLEMTQAELVYAPLWAWHATPDGTRTAPGAAWRAFREGALQPDVIADGDESWLHLEHLALSASGMIVTRSLWERTGGFPEENASFGVDDLELALRASALGIVAADPRPAGWRRIHEGQATWGVNLEARRHAAADRFHAWHEAKCRKGFSR